MLRALAPAAARSHAPVAASSVARAAGAPLRRPLSPSLRPSPLGRVPSATPGARGSSRCAAPSRSPAAFFVAAAMGNASAAAAFAAAGGAAVPTLPWSALEALSSAASARAGVPAFDAAGPPDPNGPPSAQSRLRLFGKKEEDVRVTLYRDHHAWCPYCQKVWLWLEESRVPYRVEKVTMFCYGTKETWYKQLVPSGMLPAVALDGAIITESDDILFALEAAFGPLGAGMGDAAVLPLRRLERRLFSAWCAWLCRPARGPAAEAAAAAGFEAAADAVEAALAAAPGGAGPFFLGTKFTVADVVFVPYVERMSASLYYYKGYTLRDPVARPRLCAWFDGLEALPSYRATQSDFHTHAHDLPPQMGGCYTNDTPAAVAAASRVDAGPWAGLPEAGAGTLEGPRAADPRAESAAEQALRRVLRHRWAVIGVNKEGAPEADVDAVLRATLTRMLLDEAAQGPAQAPSPLAAAPPAPAVLPARADSIARYMRDRISVPRDMTLPAGRAFRAACEATAAAAGPAQGVPIRSGDRRDQDPAAFAKAGAAAVAAR